VRYELPFGVVGKLVHRLKVEKDIKIFEGRPWIATSLAARKLMG
jgi:hypothetical protein